MEESKKYEYMNRETGEILTKDEMLQQFMEDYDGGDDTNIISWNEYYIKL